MYTRTTSPRKIFVHAFEWNDIPIYTQLFQYERFTFGDRNFSFKKFWRSICYLYPYLHHQKVLFSVRLSNRSIRKLWLFEASKDLIIISKLERQYQTIFNLKLKLYYKEKLLVHQRYNSKKYWNLKLVWYAFKICYGIPLIHEIYQY